MHDPTYRQLLYCSHFCISVAVKLNVGFILRNCQVQLCDCFVCRVVLFHLVAHLILVGIQSLSPKVSTKRISSSVIISLPCAEFPSHFCRRYAELSKTVKNEISHRGKALQALKDYFQKKTESLKKTER